MPSISAPFCETKVAGTAGAGDAFNATFTAHIALGRKPEDALRAAAINAASVVGHVDTQTGLLSQRGHWQGARGDARQAARAHMVAVSVGRPNEFRYSQPISNTVMQDTRRTMTMPGPEQIW